MEPNTEPSLCVLFEPLVADLAIFFFHSLLVSFTGDMSSPLENLQVASPNMEPKDLLPIVDDPLGEQTPQTIVAPPAPTPAAASRTQHRRICNFALLLHLLPLQLKRSEEDEAVLGGGSLELRSAHC